MAECRVVEIPKEKIVRLLGCDKFFGDIVKACEKHMCTIKDEAAFRSNLIDQMNPDTCEMEGQQEGQQGIPQFTTIAIKHIMKALTEDICRTNENPNPQCLKKALERIFGDYYEKITGRSENPRGGGKKVARACTYDPATDVLAVGRSRYKANLARRDLFKGKASGTYDSSFFRLKQGNLSYTCVLAGGGRGGGLCDRIVGWCCDPFSTKKKLFKKICAVLDAIGSIEGKKAEDVFKDYEDFVRRQENVKFYLVNCENVKWSLTRHFNDAYMLIQEKDGGYWKPANLCKLIFIFFKDFKQLTVEQVVQGVYFALENNSGFLNYDSLQKKCKKLLTDMVKILGSLGCIEDHVQFNNIEQLRAANMRFYFVDDAVKWSLQEHTELTLVEAPENTHDDVMSYMEGYLKAGHNPDQFLKQFLFVKLLKSVFTIFEDPDMITNEYIHELSLDDLRQIKILYFYDENARIRLLWCKGPSEESNDSFKTLVDFSKCTTVRSYVCPVLDSDSRIIDNILKALDNNNDIVVNKENLSSILSDVFSDEYLAGMNTKYITELNDGLYRLTEEIKQGYQLYSTIKQKNDALAYYNKLNRDINNSRPDSFYDNFQEPFKNDLLKKNSMRRSQNFFGKTLSFN